MKKIIILLLFVPIVSCSEIPENNFFYNEPIEKNMGINLMMQFHDYLAETENFHESYFVNASLYESGVSGKITLKIDKSLFDYAKSLGKDNYPNYDQWLLAEFKNCINESRVSNQVLCDLTHYKEFK
jgi:hypothetical protein